MHSLTKSVPTDSERTQSSYYVDINVIAHHGTNHSFSDLKSLMETGQKSGVASRGFNAKNDEIEKILEWGGGGTM